MTFNEYQKLAKTTFLVNPNMDDSLVLARMVLGLAGESGEVAEKMKKLLRDKDGVVDKQFVDDILKETGDILWYIAVLCDLLKIDLDEVAQVNIDKLFSRKDRGVLGGSGDER